MFIALQHAISTELIKELAVDNQNLDAFSVKLQRYPHPSFIQDLASDILQFTLPLVLMISISFPISNAVKLVALEKELQLKVFCFSLQKLLCSL